MADALYSYFARINSPGGTGVAEADEFWENTGSRDNQTCSSLETLQMIGLMILSV
jgi:hypothetical protein